MAGRATKHVRGEVVEVTAAEQAIIDRDHQQFLDDAPVRADQAARMERMKAFDDLDMMVATFVRALAAIDDGRRIAPADRAVIDRIIAAQRDNPLSTDK
jgi:hypothetical protein